MFISLNWISDFVDLSGLDKDALIHQFSLSTAEVENEIFYKGKDIESTDQCQKDAGETADHSGSFHSVEQKQDPAANGNDGNENGADPFLMQKRTHEKHSILKDRNSLTPKR